MTDTQRPIGVFDSGIGGLTVLEHLVKAFPNEDFVYVADQGHCPYGTKTAEQVGARVEKVSRYLAAQGAKAIVIACNTASLRIDYARNAVDVPVISVIQPTYKRAEQISKNKKIAVLATVATIQSGVYQQLLSDDGYTPVPLACSEFVDFVENHELDDPLGEKIVEEKLSAIKGKGFDTLIYGCTHFSLVEKQIRKVLGNIDYVNCGEPTADYLKEFLSRNNLLNKNGKKGKVNIFTTGSVENAKSNMKWFSAEHNPVCHIDIE
ncbi:MAG: glutamate racemase [Corallococcus sp.]|nr:glutamate racemase [Corallococcus sp.]